jgi:hypothetical protein
LIRGARPLTSLGDYKTDDEATAGHRFYLIESQPLGEWALIEEAAKYAGRVRQSLDLLTPSGEEVPDGE